VGPDCHALSAEREVIAIDLPGHGASPPEPDSGTFAGLVGSTQRFITESGLAGVDLVGSSMGARIVLELARRGSCGDVVALDPGGFWRGWERTYFKVTIRASVRLLRALRPTLPALSRNAASRTALLAQLSARPWALDPDLVATELKSFAATPTFDALVSDLAHGPEQEGRPPLPRTGSRSVGAGRTGSACPARPHAPKRRFRPRNFTGSTSAAISQCGISLPRRSSSFSPGLGDRRCGTPPHVPDGRRSTFQGGGIPRRSEERWFECPWSRSRQEQTSVLSPKADVLQRSMIGRLTTQAYGREP
jgi:pimeloyl-ACP methyl ester carboxylesterase